MAEQLEIEEYLAEAERKQEEEARRRDRVRASGMYTWDPLVGNVMGSGVLDGMAMRLIGEVTTSGAWVNWNDDENDLISMLPVSGVF